MDAQLPRIFTVLHDGVPVAIVQASGAAEACAIVEGVRAMDDARAILERAGLSPDAVIGASLGRASTICGRLETRRATADELALWREGGASGAQDGAIMML